MFTFVAQETQSVRLYTEYIQWTQSFHLIKSDLKYPVYLQMTVKKQASRCLTLIRPKSLARMTITLRYLREIKRKQANVASHLGNLCHHLPQSLQ